jgi:hypothetical protein
MEEKLKLKKFDLTPTWEDTAKILVMLTIDQRDCLPEEELQWARAEIIRMGKIIDYLKPAPSGA